MHASRITRNRCRGLGALALLIALPSCIIVTPAPDAPTTVTVELVNTSAFVIDANFFRSPTALDATGLFVAGNIFTGYSSSPIPTLGVNQSVSFELNCDQAAALGVRRPVFSNPVTLTGGESADEVFLRRDVGFTCGQRIRFTYSVDAAAFRVAAQVLAE